MTHRQLRVLMVTSEWPTPGRPRTTHFIRRQAEALQTAGVAVEVFHFHGGKNPLNYARTWARLRPRLDPARYDLVHAQFGQSGLLAIPKRLPLVVTFRGCDLLGIISNRDGGRTAPGRLLQRVSRFVGSRADAVILVSDHMRRALRTTAPIHVIPSGLDFELFRCHPRAEARRRLGLDPDARLVLFVGRTYEVRKRYALAREAVDVLSRRLPAELIVAWGVPHTDVPYYMSACDALVHTSMQEGSPNVVKEALACDLPVVSVPVGDVAERLRGVEGCELCPDQRPEAIAAALERVLRRGRRVDGRSAVRELDEASLTARVIEVYHSVLPAARTVTARGFDGRRTGRATPREAGRILVLDGHTNQALACVRSLGRAGFTVYVASHRRWPLAASSRHCRDRFHLADQTLGSLAGLRDWARERRVEMVLPLTEVACQLCNAERDAWQAAGITVGCGPDQILLQAFDKARTLRMAAACGIPVPETRLPRSLADYRAAADAVGYPCVIKPRFSNPWHGTSFLPDLGIGYVDGPAALEAAILARRQHDHWPMLQRWVSGVGRGVFALCDHGRPVAWFAHQRLRDVRPSGSGSSLRRSAPLDPRLREASERLLRAMRWHGPAMLEFRDDGVHPPWLMEVNGRFWGSLQLAIAAGVDFPLLWVRLLRGESVEPCDRYAEDLTLRWLWGDVKRLVHILHGRPPGYIGGFPGVLQGIRELLGPQPPGTRLETWDRADPWPAVAEWVQGVSELMHWRRQPNHVRAEAGAAP